METQPWNGKKPPADVAALCAGPSPKQPWLVRDGVKLPPTPSTCGSWLSNVNVGCHVKWKSVSDGIQSGLKHAWIGRALPLPEVNAQSLVWAVPSSSTRANLIPVNWSSHRIASTNQHPINMATAKSTPRGVCVRGRL